jgi:multidrug transporter EmrE-like cation transporter
MLLVCATMLTAGQVIWKAGLQKMGGFHPGSSTLLSSLQSLCSSPYIIAGLVIYIAATVLWLNILSNTPLSLAYPLMSISYVLGIMAGCLLFKEYAPITRWFGVVVICAGVYLVSLK